MTTPIACTALDALPSTPPFGMEPPTRKLYCSLMEPETQRSHTWCEGMGAIAYNTRSSLVLIRGTITDQCYVHDTMQPYVLPFKQRLPGATFEQYNDPPHTARGLQDSIRTVSTLHWPSRSPV
ncbi:transposable element Tcb2 transposase [Trichonephila clavipes]|nr:transposable element Tcb2 transposase [Trichonephila clavipes]